jgi:hypothetical protein
VKLPKIRFSHITSKNKGSILKYQWTCLDAMALKFSAFI